MFDTKVVTVQVLIYILDFMKKRINHKSERAKRNIPIHLERVN